MDLRIEDAEGLTTLPDSASPTRVSALFPGVPLVRSGRYKGTAGGAVTISGLNVEGEPWSRTVHAVVARDRSEVAAIWARARLRDLEDRYAVSGGDALEQEIVRTSLRHGVLCRFTAYVAIDTETATDGSSPHKVTQLVEPPAGWMDQEASRGMRKPSPTSSGVRYGAAVSHVSNSDGFGAPSAPPASPPPRMPSAASASPQLSVAAPMQDTALSTTDDTTMIREQAATEARLLRESATEPVYRRRDLLDDLASRLEALLRHFGSHDALASLIALLRDEKEPLDDRWSEALTLLDELAAEPKPRVFWKRG
jgi:Ca-activated chloride channel family protein